jgi:hypothetical protein
MDSLHSIHGELVVSLPHLPLAGLQFQVMCDCHILANQYPRHQSENSALLRWQEEAASLSCLIVP